eukprot:3534890-Amphidinium_carterae.1
MLVIAFVPIVVRFFISHALLDFESLKNLAWEIGKQVSFCLACGTMKVEDGTHRVLFRSTRVLDGWKHQQI